MKKTKPEKLSVGLDFHFNGFWKTSG